ncbi:MAG: RpoL/Rpb11 RNA polymerase subunit family protein [Candidatus Aenigmatarchaeota archaeon]|nr:hypothetical protein [Candidatus Aenigmarchaeota archaeon]
MIEIKKIDENNVIIESDDLTTLTLLNEYLWNVSGVEFCGLEREHPFLKNPKLVLRAKDAKEAIEKAKERIIDDLEKMKKKISKL